MKKISFCLVLCFVLLTTVGLAQLRINLYSAYVFDDKFSAYGNTNTYFDGKIKGGYQWGAGVEYYLRRVHSIELLYHREDTDVPVNYQAGNSIPITYETIRLHVNYIMVSAGQHYLNANGRIDGYANLMAGAGILSAESGMSHRQGTATKFSWGIKLGCNFQVTEVVGIKVQAQLISPVQAAGGSLYFGTGGAGAGLSMYSTIYQFALGGGLTFRLPQK